MKLKQKEDSYTARVPRFPLRFLRELCGSAVEK